MTMHLVGPYMTTTSYKKRKKKKLTLGKMTKYQEQMREHNKFMKRIGAPEQVMNLEEYIAYAQGNHRPKTEPRAISLPWHETGNSFERTLPVASASSENSFAPATKKPDMKYTGERKLIGIATMHKSNMVPVFADEDDVNGSKAATEIATMRRN
ncbi:MAG: hypothetical protein CBB97_09395 [Candidatus Endolissoclinum sp. TMED37]|nr:MAG: hypothetical protein CBB97_09395 [Candidatus Endolissoclinum sp. TMED37]